MISKGLENRLEQATDKFVWTHIEAMGWAEDPDYVRVKRYCLSNLNHATVTIIREKISEWMRLLEDLCGEHVHDVGDDGWSDVRNHIIGCGREAFAEATADWVYVQNIIDNGSYVESFSYGLPYDDDWTFFDRAPARANTLLAKLEKEDVPPEAAGSLIVRDVTRRLKSIANEDFKSAVNDWDKSMYDLWPNSHPLGYSPPNLISDVANFLPE